jgi:hypothetical protein
MSLIYIFTDVSELVFRQFSLNLVTVVGISMDSRPLWYSMAVGSEVTPDGITKDFSDRHPPKAHSPM